MLARSRQVRTAGRHTAPREIAPSFLMRLNLGEGGGEGAPQTSHMLQADFANMRHLASELGTALAEERSAHSRRLARRLT